MVKNEVIRNHFIMKEPSFARMGGRVTDWCVAKLWYEITI